MEGQYIALVGNVSEGYKAVGPFPTVDAACDYADGEDSWIMSLVPPTREEAN